MASEPPSILVLQHYKENLRKCSLSHLGGRPGLKFRKLRPERPVPQFPDISGLVLALGAPRLSAGDASLLGDSESGSHLVLLDSTWAKLGALLRNIASPGGDPVDDELIASGGGGGLFFRSLPADLLTAYPRRSKLFEDPHSGLASVEALVVALEVLCMPRRDLLDGYRWQQEFLEANRTFFQ